MHFDESSSSMDRPNILFILSDQHSKFHLGCYGDPLVRTPHLDRLASEGMRFANAYTPSPLCVPARMAFMTGRRPSANQVWGNDHARRRRRGCSALLRGLPHIYDRKCPVSPNTPSIHSHNPAAVASPKISPRKNGLARS